MGMKEFKVKLTMNDSEFQRDYDRNKRNIEKNGVKVPIELDVDGVKSAVNTAQKAAAEMPVDLQVKLSGIDEQIKKAKQKINSVAGDVAPVEFRIDANETDVKKIKKQLEGSLKKLDVGLGQALQSKDINAFKQQADYFVKAIQTANRLLDKTGKKSVFDPEKFKNFFDAEGLADEFGNVALKAYDSWYKVQNKLSLNIDTSSFDEVTKEIQSLQKEKDKLIADFNESVKINVTPEVDDASLDGQIAALQTKLNDALGNIKVSIDNGSMDEAYSTLQKVFDTINISHLDISNDDITDLRTRIIDALQGISLVIDNKEEIEGLLEEIRDTKLSKAANFTTKQKENLESTINDFDELAQTLGHCSSAIQTINDTNLIVNVDEGQLVTLRQTLKNISEDFQGVSATLSAGINVPKAEKNRGRSSTATATGQINKLQKQLDKFRDELNDTIKQLTIESIELSPKLQDNLQEQLTEVVRGLTVSIDQLAIPDETLGQLKQVEDESVAIAKLNDVLDEVIDRLGIKNDAFREEANVVDEVVKSEITSLTSLSNKVDSINTGLANAIATLQAYYSSEESGTYEEANFFDVSDVDAKVAKKLQDELTDKLSGITLERLNVDASSLIDIRQQIESALQNIKVSVTTDDMMLASSAIDNFNGSGASDEEFLKEILNVLNGKSDEAVKALKEMSAADALIRQRETRNGQSGDYSEAYKKTGERERGGFINTRTGRIGNTYVADSSGSFKYVDELADIEKRAHGVKNISDIYDLFFHTHPINTEIDGIKYDKIVEELADGADIKLFQPIISGFATGLSKQIYGEESKLKLKLDYQKIFKDTMLDADGIYSGEGNPEDIQMFIARMLDYASEQIEDSGNHLSNKDQQKAIGLIYDSIIDSIRKSIDTNSDFTKYISYKKDVGPDGLFSSADARTNATNVHNGIYKQAILSEGQVTLADMSGLSEGLADKIWRQYGQAVDSQEFKNKVQQEAISGGVIDRTKVQKLGDKVWEELFKQFNLNFTDYIKHMSVDDFGKYIGSSDVLENARQTIMTKLGLSNTKISSSARREDVRVGSLNEEGFFDDFGTEYVKEFVKPLYEALNSIQKYISPEYFSTLQKQISSINMNSFVEGNAYNIKSTIKGLQEKILKANLLDKVDSITIDDINVSQSAIDNLRKKIQDSLSGLDVQFNTSQFIAANNVLENTEDARIIQQIVDILSSKGNDIVKSFQEITNSDKYIRGFRGYARPGNPTTGELERQGFFNYKSGLHGNLFTYGFNDETPIHNYGDENFDSAFHTHPINIIVNGISPFDINTSKNILTRNSRGKDWTETYQKYVSKNAFAKIYSLAKQSLDSFSDNDIFTKYLNDAINEIFSPEYIKKKKLRPMMPYEFSSLIFDKMSDLITDSTELTQQDKIDGRTIISQAVLSFAENLKGIIDYAFKTDDYDDALIGALKFTKDYGHQVGFSEGDMSSFLTDKERGIDRQYVLSNGKITELDISEIDKDTFAKIVKKYNETIQDELSNNDREIHSNPATGAYDSRFQNQDEVTNAAHKAMRIAFDSVGLDVSKSYHTYTIDEFAQKFGGIDKIEKLSELLSGVLDAKYRTNNQMNNGQSDVVPSHTLDLTIDDDIWFSKLAESHRLSDSIPEGFISKSTAEDIWGKLSSQWMKNKYHTEDTRASYYALEKEFQNLKFGRGDERQSSIRTVLEKASALFDQIKVEQGKYWSTQSAHYDKDANGFDNNDVAKLRAVFEANNGTGYAPNGVNVQKIIDELNFGGELSQDRYRELDAIAQKIIDAVTASASDTRRFGNRAYSDENTKLVEGYYSRHLDDKFKYFDENDVSGRAMLEEYRRATYNPNVAVDDIVRAAQDGIAEEERLAKEREKTADVTDKAADAEKKENDNGFANTGVDETKRVKDAATAYKALNEILSDLRNGYIDVDAAIRRMGEDTDKISDDLLRKAISGNADELVAYLDSTIKKIQDSMQKHSKDLMTPAQQDIYNASQTNVDSLISARDSLKSGTFFDNKSKSEVAEITSDLKILGNVATETWKQFSGSEAKDFTKLSQIDTMLKQLGYDLQRAGRAPSDLREEANVLIKQMTDLHDEAVSAGSAFVNLNKADLSALRAQVSGVQVKLQEFGGKGFLKKIGASLTALNANAIGYFFSFWDIIRYVQEAANVIKEYDSALVEMQKVSESTRSELEAFAKSSFDIGASVGTSGLQIQQSTADFMRLGQSLSEASKNAETANKLLNVSEFTSIDDATTALISMEEAYQNLSGDRIIDSLNKVG